MEARDGQDARYRPGRGGYDPEAAITLRKALVGFVEVKAPGKGADPRRFKDRHDKDQWEKLKSLPNLIYTDGNSFSLWRDGKPEGPIVQLEGNVEIAGAKLAAPDSLLALFTDFLRWALYGDAAARARLSADGTRAGVCRLEGNP